MLQNAYLFAKIGADTAENEQHFAENVGKIGRRAAVFRSGGGGGAAWPPAAPARRGSRASRESARQGCLGFRGLAKLGKLANFANFRRARSRLYQNEFLQENMRLTAFDSTFQALQNLHTSALF